MKKSHRKLIAVFIFFLVAGNLLAGAEDVNIHGFISQGYLKTDQNNYLAETDDGSFQFNEMGINFTTFVSSDLKLGCQFFARDLGNVGNDEIVVNWALAEYTFKNWLGLRAGIVKAAFGFYNDLRDFDSLRTSIFLPSSVYNEWLRDGINSFKGIGLFGVIDVGPAGIVEYQLQTGETQISLDSGTALLITEINEGFENLASIDVGQIYTLRMIWSTPIDGLRVGASYLQADSTWKATRVISNTIKYPVTFVSDPFHYIVYSIEYVYQNLTFAAENYQAKREATAYVTGFSPVNQDLDSKDSFYVRLGYRFTDWFEAGYYFSKYINNPDVETDDNELKDHCVSLRFDINPNWVAKLETHVMEGNFGVYPDNDKTTYNEWMLYVAKVSYSF